MKRKTEEKLLIALGVAAVATAAYALVVAPRMRRWGATDEEFGREMEGDELVPAPESTVTRAITINARPEHIFPWIVQMGEGRGGLYSYDWLDRLFGFLSHNSAERILPQFQDLKDGDKIPLGAGPPFPIYRVVKDRLLIIGEKNKGMGFTWQIELIPMSDGRTRLVSRNRSCAPPNLAARLMMLILDPAAFVMTRKWMLNLKRLAERTAIEE